MRLNFRSTGKVIINESRRKFLFIVLLCPYVMTWKLTNTDLFWKIDVWLIEKKDVWLAAEKGTNRDKTPFQNAVKSVFYLDVM